MSVSSHFHRVTSTVANTFAKIAGRRTTLVTHTQRRTNIDWHFWSSNTQCYVSANCAASDCCRKELSRHIDSGPEKCVLSNYCFQLHNTSYCSLIARCCIVTNGHTASVFRVEVTLSWSHRQYPTGHTAKWPTQIPR